MVTDCFSVDSSIVVNAAQSAAKDLGYENLTQKQL